MLWFVPVLLLLLTVTLYPTLFVIWMSFQKTKFYELAGFVGLANYVDTLSSRAFWETTYTSLVYMAGSLVLSLGLGVLAALVLNNLRRGGAVLRVLTLVPWTLSMAVVGTIWLWLFNPSYGPISYSMRELGVSPGLMLGDPELALWLTILVTSWWSFPYAMVIVTAAIQSIPKELYEAVSIDGGGWRAKLRYVTWPHLIPTLGSTALTLGILYLTLITLMIVLTGGGPLGADDDVELRSVPRNGPGGQHRTDRGVLDRDPVGERRAGRALHASHWPRDGLARGRSCVQPIAGFETAPRFCILAALVVGSALGPMLWAISTSLKNEVNAVSAIPSLIPSPATLSNYLSVFSHKTFVIELLNSILYAAGAVAIALAVGIPAGYAASRYTFPGKRAVDAADPRDVDGPRSCASRSNLLSARSPRSSEQSFRDTRHPGLTHRTANGVVHRRTSSTPYQWRSTRPRIWTAPAAGRS